MSERPAVDVVVPFRGSSVDLDLLAERLGTLHTKPGDTITLADNRPGAKDDQRGAIRILGAGERQTSYYARNRGVQSGEAPWLVFIDADVVASPDLLDRYFEMPPGERTGVLAGAIVDEVPSDGPGNAAVRYAYLKHSMSQDTVLANEEWAFAQTANAAIRREAFAQVGGFEPKIRSGGDADLCFRLRAAGWGLERRDGATVVHRNRTTVPRMLAQRARHGAGAAWLARKWPGAMPRRQALRLAFWGVRRAVRGLIAAARGDRDAAVLGFLDGPSIWAYELGRLLPNRATPRMLARR